MPLQSILNETLILYPATPRPSYADQVLEHFSARGHTVTKTLETNGLHTALGLVAAGIGVTLVPASVKLLQRCDIAYRPLTEQGWSTPLIMTIRTGEENDLIRRFKEHLNASATSSDDEHYAREA